MVQEIFNTTVYKSLNLNGKLNNAYLFYSIDSELNNLVAKGFAKSLMCEKGTACNNCNACKQFESKSNPDLIIVDQAQIKVEDANNIILKLSTKPINNKYKIFLILNAENINEISQNKLLKSLEEPNENCIFILTTSKMDKLLPTVLSRLNKIYVPSPTNADKQLLSNGYKNLGINLSELIDKNLTLTQMLNFATNDAYKKTLNAIVNLFSKLKTTSDIPTLVSQLGECDKVLFFQILQDIILDCVSNGNKFDKNVIYTFTYTFSKQALINIIPLVEDAYKKIMSNVNFTFVLDNLLFNILKEKFLCK